MATRRERKQDRKRAERERRLLVGGKRKNIKLTLKKKVAEVVK